VRVFGSDSAIDAALQRRVSALAAAAGVDILLHADRLRSLACALAGTCEAIEMESSDAADLRVYLSAVNAECDLIATTENLAEDRAAA
jgi:hypothetical protein